MDFTLNATSFTVVLAYILVLVSSKTFMIRLRYDDMALFLYRGLYYTNFGNLV